MKKMLSNLEVVWKLVLSEIGAIKPKGLNMIAKIS
jgi:hypothetical protein